jgi:hypothetical protein
MYLPLKQITLRPVYLVIEKKEEVSSLENSSGCSHILQMKDRMQLLGILAIMMVRHCESLP